MACCHGMADPFIVVGAGIFGVTAALELRARGHTVTLLDPGPIPAPLAASTDISKVVRMEYGPDRDYMALMEEARSGWLRWNERWAADGTGPLYHESGVLMVTRAPMAPGGFEHDSYRMLLARGHRPERMDAAAITRRYPAWSTGRFVDGFYHRKGGYAESGTVVAALARQARADGVTVCEGSRVTALIEGAGRVRGVRTDRGQELLADAVVLATGAWAGTLHPPLAGAIRASGHPVFHLRPADPAPFRSERFPTFTADVARTGYYGFPVNAQGVVKVASHALGQPIDPDAPRHLAAGAEPRLRQLSPRHLSGPGRRPRGVHALVPVRRHAGRGFLDRTRSGAGRADRGRRRQRPRIQVRAGAGRSDRRRGHRRAQPRARQVPVASRSHLGAWHRGSPLPPP